MAALGLVWASSRSARAQDAADDRGPIIKAEAPTPFAFNYGETETTRAGAMGGAMRAAGNGTTAQFLNPANLGLTRIYHIEAMGQLTPEFGRHVYGGAIVDSTNVVAGGVSLQGGFLNPSETDRSFLDVRVGFAYTINENIFVGLGGRYLKLVQDGVGPLGASKASGGLKDPQDPESRSAIWEAPTFDAGVTLRLADMIHIGLVGQNLTFPETGFLPTTLGGGIAVATNDFTIEADAVADLSSYVDPVVRVMAGGEYLVADRVPLRLGYRFDQGANSHALSGGVGYLSPEFSIEASVRRTLVGPGATTIMFGVAYFLESSGLIKTGAPPAEGF